MTSDSNFEDFFLSPVSDEQYAKRMRSLRDNFKFFKLKYGTVGKVARRLGRSSIQIEISGEYCEIIKERMEWGSGFDIEWELHDQKGTVLMEETEQIKESGVIQ